MPNGSSACSVSRRVHCMPRGRKRFCMGPGPHRLWFRHMDACEVDESTAVERARASTGLADDASERSMERRSGQRRRVAQCGSPFEKMACCGLWEWLTVSTRRAKDGEQCARVALTSRSSRAEDGVSYLCGFGVADRRRSGTVISGGAVRAC